VILLWFVLHLLIGVIYCACFVIDDILVLITVAKSGLYLLIFREEDVYTDKLTNL